MTMETIKRVGDIIDDVVGTDRNDLIRDCINFQKMLFGFGLEQYRIAVVDPVRTFDILHELSVDELQAYNLALSSALSKLAITKVDEYNRKHGFDKL